MNKDLSYELEILYTPTDRSDAQITELGNQHGASVRNNVMNGPDIKEEILQKYDSEVRARAQEGFPMGVVTFQPLKYDSLCGLVQSALDVLEVRTMAPRALK
ncbi:MAG: hypothetical protein KKA65_03545 [Nanoarchaeota archaeon]|nr:hypothetical protein [Nanoarchaeota archaeon]MBU4241868.1 hypothetical protein [Nanoarchaeota archaeon]MBU4352092.1 hypothetical protein [Nanoarchaeota archaeon]MBU4456552.1 hypothetical protein [Nanoarchaeota archaeon]MCG2719914.1 hypothetical protein [Nanoarchaeota archaeon]